MCLWKFFDKKEKCTKIIKYENQIKKNFVKLEKRKRKKLCYTKEQA